MAKARRADVPPLTEAAFQRQVVQLATLCGYKCYHTYDSRRSQRGFPDLVICGRGKVLFVELKTDRGRPSFEQEEWLEALREAGCDARLWRPSDWPEIEAALSR